MASEKLSISPSIPPATLVSGNRHIVPGPYMVTEYLFSVPLDYSKPKGERIQLFARAATKHDPSFFGSGPDPPQAEQLQSQSQRPWIVYLQGGPGFGCPEPQESALTRFVLTKGYQILYLDYRGVGLSTPITADTVGTTSLAPVEYLKLFRQDNNVRDLEAVRKCLTASIREPEKRKWSILGQSFGGFVSLTYLSKYPEGLREVFTMGGLAPIARSPQEVYRSTFSKVEQRNAAYYRKFPEDIMQVQQIALWLEEKAADGGVKLPGGGILTPRRFLTLGHLFGMHGGFDSVHAVVLRMALDLQQFKTLTRPTLTTFETFLPFDSCPVYAILHEAIYCYKPGLASSWAAQEVGERLASFRWLSNNYSFSDGAFEPLYFSGEMIFPFMLEDYPELQALRREAQLLAEFDQWDTLYDEGQLRRNTVPVFAASYIEDMYVDYELARETARKVNGIKTFETNILYHNALRARADEVLTQLFRLRDDCLD